MRHCLVLKNERSYSCAGHSENESRIGDDEDDGPLYIIDGVAYRTGLAAPPPEYDEALTMRKPTEGEIIRFTVGNGTDDGILFEFVMPSNELVSVNDSSDETAAAAAGSRDASGSTYDSSFYRFRFLPPPVYCGRVALIASDNDNTASGLLPLTTEVEVIDETQLSTMDF